MTPSKKMLIELRELAEAEEISTNAALRLLLSAVGDLFEKVESIAMTNQNLEKERQASLALESRRLDELQRLVAQIQTTTESIDNMTIKFRDSLQADITLIRTDLQVLEKNYLIQLGHFLQTRPKVAGTIFVIILIFANLWFVASFRQSVLLMLRVPHEVIDLVNPPVPTPIPQELIDALIRLAGTPIP